jgi:hypothetical protein
VTLRDLCAGHFDIYGKLPKFVRLLTEFPDFFEDFMLRMPRLADEFDHLRAQHGDGGGD